jgi:hypothetical protein
MPLQKCLVNEPLKTWDEIYLPSLYISQAPGGEDILDLYNNHFLINIALIIRFSL